MGVANFGTCAAECALLLPKSGAGVSMAWGFSYLPFQGTSLRSYENATLRADDGRIRISLTAYLSLTACR